MDVNNPFILFIYLRITEDDALDDEQQKGRTYDNCGQVDEEVTLRVT